jgi:hypothetical protein
MLLERGAKDAARRTTSILTIALAGVARRE